MRAPSLSDALSLLLVLALGVGCGGAGAGRAEPPLTPQPKGAFVPVPYPPPPARVEFAPATPSADAVWIGGEWDYRFRRWIWTYGRWVTPPSGARYARWSLERDPRGELSFAPGAWRDAKGKVVEAPSPLATARARESSVTEEDGTKQQVGPNNAPPPPVPAQ